MVSYIKKYFVNLIGFFQYHCSFKENYFPCRLVGEKRINDSQNTIIIFHLSGKTKAIELSIQDLLENNKLLSCFHPFDAFQIGSIAFEEFIRDIPHDLRKGKFENIKKIMLNSLHEVNHNQHHTKVLQKKYSSPKDHYIVPVNLDKIKNNKYQFKLVAGHTKNSKTTITFTLLGKREGYKKTLRQLIVDKDIIKKFHPITVFKFGFIALGDTLFELSKTEQLDIKIGVNQ